VKVQIVKLQNAATLPETIEICLYYRNDTVTIQMATSQTQEMKSKPKA
jgi:hypothetical protein